MAKRMFDFAVALTLLLLAFPLFILTAILVRTKLSSPVLFSQVRPGLGGRPFRLFKFRSMSDGCDDAGKTLPDAARLTPFGKLLRSTSLDELPSLWNVLAGEMSLVGPRPLLMSYLPLYSPEQARRQDVRPGVTGWAQINGRNALDWDEKFVLDVWYVDNRSFLLDLKILVMTVQQVAHRKDISAVGQATMTAFTGSTPKS